MPVDVVTPVVWSRMRFDPTASGGLLEAWLDAHLRPLAPDEPSASALLQTGALTVGTTELRFRTGTDGWVADSTKGPADATRWRTVTRASIRNDEIFLEYGIACFDAEARKLEHLGPVPGFLRDLCVSQKAELRAAFPPTGELFEVEADGVPAVIDALFSGERVESVLFVSEQKSTGRPLVEAARLAAALTGQVSVVLLKSTATWSFAEHFQKLGAPRELGVCFDGAARLYLPGLVREAPLRNHPLFLSRALETTRGDRTEWLALRTLERHLGATVPPRAFIAVEQQERQARQASTRRLLAGASNTDDTDAAQALVNAFKRQLEAAEKEREEWLAEVERLEAKVLALEKAEGEAPLDDAGRTLAAMRAADRRKLEHLEQALQALQGFYGDRVDILDSAWKSAREARAFTRPDKAFELMRTLATQYWELVQQGGDAAAKGAFTEATFSSRESETVESRPAARALRTFLVRGEPVTMWKHLKIGTKDSVAETWRLHFVFDAERRKVVIGHCGKHLDFD